MEQSPSWEANRFSASQEIPHILWNPKVHYRTHTCLPPFHILSQIDPILSLNPTFRRSILILSSHLSFGFPSGLFPSGFTHKNPVAHPISSIRATCSANLILFYLITRMIFGEQYSSLRSSLCSFLHSPCYLVPLRPNFINMVVNFQFPNKKLEIFLILWGIITYFSRTPLQCSSSRRQNLFSAIFFPLALRAFAPSFLRFLDHTQRRTTVGRTPLDEWSARCRDLYLTTHNTYNRQTSMPPVGFEPTISAGELLQT